MTTLTPQPCSGSTRNGGCGGHGVRVPAGINGTGLVCWLCDNPQLITGPLLARPAGGYNRSHFPKP